MITRENFKEVVKSLSDKDKKRILNSDKEYCVLYLHTFNVGSYTTATLTDDFNRYKNVSNHGNAILYTQEIQDMINAEEYE
jgi:hypothetical protein